MANFNDNPYSSTYGFGGNQQNYLNAYMQNQNQRMPNNYPPAFANQEPISLKGKPVTSIEEARANSVDLDGTISYFPDISNKRIYTKQYKSDGSVDFKVYVEDQTSQSSLRYVTEQELVDVVAGLRTMINNYVLLGASAQNTTVPNSCNQPQTTNQTEEKPSVNTFNI